MPAERPLISIATFGLILVSISATRFGAAGSHARLAPRGAPGPCALLTAGDATAALGASSQPGKEMLDGTGCVWSNDPAASDSSRRVTLVFNSLRSFKFAMKPAITTIKVEPV